MFNRRYQQCHRIKNKLAGACTSCYQTHIDTSEPCINSDVQQRPFLMQTVSLQPSQVVCKWQSGAAWEQSKHPFSFKGDNGPVQWDRVEGREHAQTQSKCYRHKAFPLRPSETQRNCWYEILNQLRIILGGNYTFIVMLYPNRVVGIIAHDFAHVSRKKFTII